MYSDFWFNSERVLTDARLPAALSSIHMPRDGGGWWVYANAPTGDESTKGFEGVAVAGVDSPLIKV